MRRCLRSLPFSLRWSDALQAAKVRAQGFRDDDRAVRLLVVLEDSEPGAPHRESAAVQRMEQLSLAGLAAAETQVGAARLECLEVGAGRNLFVVAVRGQPHLEVVGLGRAESQVAGAQ